MKKLYTYCLINTYMSLGNAIERHFQCLPSMIWRQDIDDGECCSGLEYCITYAKSAQAHGISIYEFDLTEDQIFDLLFAEIDIKPVNSYLLIANENNEFEIIDFDKYKTFI